MRTKIEHTYKEMKDGTKVVTVDTKNSTYQGKQWKDLSIFQKRKFENLVVLSKPRERANAKIRYE